MNKISPAHIEPGMRIRTIHPRSMWNGVTLRVLSVEHDSPKDPVLRRSLIDAVAPNGSVYRGFLRAADESWERLA